MAVKLCKLNRKYVNYARRLFIKAMLLAGCTFGFYVQYKKVTEDYRSYPFEVVMMDEREKELKFPSISICTDMWIDLDSEKCHQEPELCTLQGQILTLGLFKIQFDPWLAASLAHKPEDIFKCTMKSLVPQCKSFNCINHLRKTLFWPSSRFCYTVDNYMYADSLHPFQHCDKPWMYELTVEHFWSNRTLVLMNSKTNPVFFQEPYTTNAPYAAPFYMEPGQQMSVSMQQTVFKRLKAPYASNCRDYYGEGLTTRFYGNKLRQACLQNCTMYKEIEQCGCYLDLHQYTYPEAPGKPCNFLQGFLCFDKVQATAQKHCLGECTPACSETDYDIHTYGIKYLYKDDGTPDVNRMIYKARFRTDKVFFSIEQPALNFLEVSAYIGGLMGVWLGCSLYYILLAVHNGTERGLAIFWSMVKTCHQRRKERLARF